MDVTDEETRKTPILTTASGDLTEVIKGIEALVQKFESVGDNVNLVLSDARGLVADVRKKIAVIDLEGIQGNVLEASASLKETLKSLQGRVDQIADRVTDAATNLKSLTQHGDEVVTAAGIDVKEILANIKALSADLKAIVARAGPKVDLILDEVGRRREEGEPGGRASSRGSGTKVGGVVDGAGHDLTKVLEQITQVGHNIADITEDLKSHPWKLANRPEDKEIAFENLRNAAASYVRGVGVDPGDARRREGDRGPGRPRLRRAQAAARRALRQAPGRDGTVRRGGEAVHPLPPAGRRAGAPLIAVAASRPRRARPRARVVDRLGPRRADPPRPA